MTENKNQVAIDGLLSAANFAQLGTVNSKQQPHIDTVWFERDADDLLVATTLATLKAKNLQRNPAAYIVVTHRENPYEQVQIKAQLLAVEEDDDLEVCDRIAKRYTGRKFPQRRHNGRVVLRLRMLNFKYHIARV
jgi:PPOX class probable F420-dependent enzyme